MDISQSILHEQTGGGVERRNYQHFNVIGKYLFEDVRIGIVVAADNPDIA